MLEQAPKYAVDLQNILFFVLILNDKQYRVLVWFIVFTWARSFQWDMAWPIGHNL